MSVVSQKFYKCRHCGNIASLIMNAGVPMVCCGEKMEELIPNSNDASLEKHVPVIKVEKNKVTIKIGSAPHPMTKEHHIGWVYIQTKNGGQRKNLKIDGDPIVNFSLTDDDKLKTAFAYCNLHGLWKAEN